MKTQFISKLLVYAMAIAKAQTRLFSITQTEFKQFTTNKHFKKFS